LENLGKGRNFFWHPLFVGRGQESIPFVDRKPAPLQKAQGCGTPLFSTILKLVPDRPYPFSGSSKT
jgi:hypothetical protein